MPKTAEPHTLMALTHVKGKTFLLHPSQVAAIVPVECLSGTPDSNCKTAIVIGIPGFGTFEVRDTLAVVEAEYVRAKALL